MTTEQPNTAADHYSPAQPVPTLIVCSTIAAVFLMIAVVLGYAAWTARQHYDPHVLAQEAESAVRRGHALTVQPATPSPAQHAP